MGIRMEINSDFFKRWTPEMAYVLGFVTADGSLENAPYIRAKYLRICSKDKPLLEKIKNVMRSKHNIQKYKPKLSIFNDGKNKSHICHSSERFLLRIGSHEIYNDLTNLGLIPQKSKIIQFPSIPKQFLPHYIRGYFDGDGCIYIRKDRLRIEVIFTSGSQQFLKGLSKAIASTLKIKPHKIYINRGSYQLRYSTKESVPLLDYMYTNLSGTKLYLQRKHNIYVEALRKYNRARYPSG